MWKRYGAAMLVAVLFCALLAGCSGTYYTEDLKQAYEQEVFPVLEERLYGTGADPSAAMYELFAPDGLTKVVTGRFFLGSEVIQFAYDGSQDIMWASRTASGFRYRDAVAYVEQEIGKVCDGTGLYDVSVRSMSWSVPYMEYRYDVQEKDDSKSVSNRKSPKEQAGWLRRAFFPWNATDVDVRESLNGMLHGAPDDVSDLCIEVSCESFADPGAVDEVTWHRIMSAFSSVRAVYLYEDGNRERYCLQERTDAGVTITWHEQEIDTNGNVRWVSRDGFPPEMPVEEE